MNFEFQNFRDKSLSPEHLHRLWLEYEGRISEATIIRDLLRKEYLRTVKHLYGWDVLETIAISSFMKDKSSQNKRHLKSRLNEAFGNMKWNLDNIVYLGMEPYGYQIPFVLNKTEYCLEIPVWENLSLSNMQCLAYGKYCVVRKTNHCTELIFSDFEKAKVAEYLSQMCLNSMNQNQSPQNISIV